MPGDLSIPAAACRRFVVSILCALFGTLFVDFSCVWGFIASPVILGLPALVNSTSIFFMD